MATFVSGICFRLQATGSAELAKRKNVIQQLGSGAILCIFFETTCWLWCNSLYQKARGGCGTNRQPLNTLGICRSIMLWELRGRVSAVSRCITGQERNASPGNSPHGEVPFVSQHQLTSVCGTTETLLRRIHGPRSAKLSWISRWASGKLDSKIAGRVPRRIDASKCTFRRC
jgi:hypothetical protein